MAKLAVLGGIKYDDGGEALEVPRSQIHISLDDGIPRLKWRRPEEERAPILYA